MAKLTAMGAAQRMMQERGYVVIGYPPNHIMLPKLHERVWEFAGWILPAFWALDVVGKTDRADWDTQVVAIFGNAEYDKNPKQWMMRSTSSGAIWCQMPKLLLDIPRSTIDAFDAGWRATSARSRSGLMVKVLNDWAEVAGGAPCWAVSSPPAEVVEFQAEINQQISMQAEVIRLRPTPHEPWCIQAREPSLPCNCGAERRAGK